MAPASLDLSEDLEPRGWAMRRGHRARLSGVRGREAHRGRASFARSVNKGAQRFPLEEGEPKRRQQRRLLQELCCEAADCEVASPCCPGAAPVVRCHAAREELSPWQRAEARARAAREALPAGGKPAKKKEWPRAKPLEQPALPPTSRGFPTVPVVGRSAAPLEHEALMAFVEEGFTQSGFPAWWSGVEGDVAVKSGREYDLVTEYFLATMPAGSSVEVRGLQRIQRRGVFRSCQGLGAATLMFHGCRTAQNEASIRQGGFRSDVCRSGGPNFGTWFAYGAAYSNSGFVYQEQDGLRHIFICVVYDRVVRLDNCTMRVVADGCAYPQWLLTYHCRLPNAGPGNKRAGTHPEAFWVVQDGRWVPVRMN